MKYFKYIMAALIIATASANYAEARYIDGSGIVKKEKRNISGAKYLINESSAKVIISMGNNEEVVVESDDNLINLVNTYVKNNKLVISMANVSYKTRYMVVYVTMKEINGLKVRGSGDILSKGQIRSNDMTVLVEGSGNINIANIIAHAITVAVFGSGDVKIAGESDLLNAEITGSGDVAAQLLRTRDSNIKITGSGDCVINTDNQAMIKIIGSGDVYLYREPKSVKRSIVGSGDIRMY